MRGVSLAIRRRAFDRTVDDLMRAPWGRREAMDERKDRLLRRTIDVARKTPYYAPLLDGIAVDGIADLERVPVTGKRDVVASGRSRAVPGSRLRRRRKMGTSGSSGEPMQFEVDRLYAVRHNAGRAFVYRAAGVPEGACVVEIVAGTATIGEPDPVCTMFRRHVVGYSNPDWLDEVYRAAPDFVYGNRSHLLALAERPLPARPPKWMCSSSETLHPEDRATIRDHFGIEPFEIYGSAEASNVAYRLDDREPWVVLEPRVHVEVLDDEHRPVGPGEIGEIVVTTLTEPTTPLVRYATGDLARLAPRWRIGQPEMKLESLEGRSSDSIVDADGRSVSFWTVATSGFWAKGEVGAAVNRWQVHQTEDRSIVVSIELVEGDAGPDAVRAQIRDFLVGVLGDVAVEVRIVDQVHDVDGGKFRAVTSAVSGA